MRVLIDVLAVIGAVWLAGILLLAGAFLLLWQQERERREQ